MSSVYDSGSPVVAVPVWGRLDLLGRCLRSIDACTDVGVEVLVLDDAGPEAPSQDFISTTMTSGRAYRLIRNEENLGFVVTANRAFALRDGRDIVLVNSDVEVFPGWLTGLRNAVTSSPSVATASALSNDDSILSVRPLTGAGSDFSRVAAAIVQSPEECLPAAARIPVAVGHCLYLKDAALTQVGAFDLAFAPGYGEEVDWSLRARRKGWSHVAALRTIVRHDAGGSFGVRLGSRRDRVRRAHEMLLAFRYPSEWMAIRRFARDPHSDLAQALRLVEGLV